MPDMKLRRFVAPFFAVAGLALIPWTIWLTSSLPSHHETGNWKTVWAGFDLAEAAALIATAVTAVRRSPWLGPVAAITGTLLLVDAWFDIMLEDGGKHLLAAGLEAGLVEVPLAVICFWVARDVERALSRALPAPWRRAVMRAFTESGPE
jgi:hypothetical protein